MNKIKLDELSPGMIIAENIFDPKSKKLLLKSDTKLTEQIIKSLHTHNITELSVSERYTLCIDPIDTTRKELKISLIEDLTRIVPPRAEANPTDIITAVAEKCIGLIDDIIESDDIVGYCVQMKLVDNEYLFKHCVNTCVLSILVAGLLGLDTTYVITVGRAALIHDLGLCEMPTLIRITQRNKQEESLWQEHAKYGYYFAKEKGVCDCISKIILHHHENWDGSGFPEKLARHNIPIGSRIIAVCENYDELVRVHKKPNYEAIEYIYEAGNLIFDTNIIKALTNNIAVYPLGSLVRLSNGEVGVVVNVRKNLGPRPVIKVYFNRFNRPLKSPIEVDLGIERDLFIKEVL